MVPSSPLELWAHEVQVPKGAELLVGSRLEGEPHPNLCCTEGIPRQELLTPIGKARIQVLRDEEVLVDDVLSMGQHGDLAVRVEGEEGAAFVLHSGDVDLHPSDLEILLGEDEGDTLRAGGVGGTVEREGSLPRRRRR